ncbi:MAG: hypothetical protein ACRD3P_08755 [Terriglobales bacterium]
MRTPRQRRNAGVAWRNAFPFPWESLIVGTRSQYDPVLVIAILGWQDKSSRERCSRLQLNLFTTLRLVQNGLKIVAGPHLPYLARCRGAAKRAWYRHAGQLGWSIELRITGGWYFLRGRTRKKAGQYQEQEGW